MIRCSCCGITDDVVGMNQYLVCGINPLTKKRTKRRVNICDCCSAWGMGFKEKIEELSGLDSVKIKGE